MLVISIVFISLLVVALLSLLCILFVREIKATDKDKKRKIIGKRRNRKYVDFVNEHSLAIRAIKELNSKYQFSSIYPLIYKYCYDSTRNFEKVSCKDYLIYQFHLDTLSIRRIIKSRNNNISKEIDYKSKVDLTKDKLGNFDVSIEDLDEEKLRNIESIVFNDLIEKANTDFYAEVHLYLTRGRMHRVIDEKKESFDLNEIIDALKSIDSSIFLFPPPQTLFGNLIFLCQMVHRHTTFLNPQCLCHRYRYVHIPLEIYFLFLMNFHNVNPFDIQEILISSQG